MSDYERNPQAIESTNTANPYEPLSETKVGDTELLEGDSPAPGVCRVVMLPPEAVEKDKELDRKTTERAAQVHAGAAEIAAESASPFKTDFPSPTDSEAMSHPMETANMVLNAAGTAVSESLSAAQDSASATLASAKDAASSTLASAKDSTASTLTSAKDTASSTLASAQKTTSSALASAQDTATMALASAQQTAASAASTVQDTAASALASVHHAGQTTLHKAQDLGSATATVASRSMHATQGTATQLAATTADHVRRVSASLASTASEMLHSAEETAAKVAVQVLETVEHSIEMLRDQYVGSAQAGAHEQLDKDLQQRAKAEQQGKMTSVKDELAHVADMVVASAEDMLRKASEGSASTLGRDPNVQVEGTPGTVDQPESDMASVLTAESSEVDEQAPVEGFQEHEEFVIREGLPADKGSERAARKVMRAMEKESTQEMMEEDDTASMTA